MALNKQKILNELGNVVNQLQSADCGCMQSLFSNSSGHDGHMNSVGGSQPVCGGRQHGCCHNYGGYNGAHSYAHERGAATPCAGEPYGNKNMCMGQCNPHKLYSETYNYLNQNIMQPTVKEVYDDLKSISPANTIVNDSMGTKLGLMQQGLPFMQGDMGIQQKQLMSPSLPHNSQMQNSMHETILQNHKPNNYYQMPQYEMQTKNMNYPTHKGLGNGLMPVNHIPENAINNNINPMLARPANQNVHEGMAGMGPQIVNMIMSSGSTKKPNLNPYGDQMGPTISNTPQFASHGKSSSQSDANGNFNQQHYAANSDVPLNISSSPNRETINAQANHMTDSSGGTRNSYFQQGQSLVPQLAQSHLNAHQMPDSGNYGQHSKGISKFNEMFPGVTNGDLGFDPMAIAIQMNPANHQENVINTMKKMMNGDISTAHGDTANSGHNKTAIDGAKGALASISQGNSTPYPQQSPVEEGDSNRIFANLQQNYDNQVLSHHANSASIGQVPTIQHGQFPEPEQMHGQQMYQTYTQHQTFSNPTKTFGEITTPVPTPYNEERANNNDSQMQQHTQGFILPQSTATSEVTIKDPILPVDTSRYQLPASMKRSKYHDYNTLGQPVQKLPASMYMPPQGSLPQTLSPQPITRLRNDHARFNVKATESKTALMGNKPLGRTPSKKQLQEIYNQYKGSQSFTEQNIKNAQRNGTYSERTLNIPQGPVERFGGDTAANTNLFVSNNSPVKGNSQLIDQIGDTLVANKPHGDFVPAPMQEPVMKQGKCRNGLQDQTYTSYITSAAWSFHGERNLPFVGRRYNYRG